MYIYILYVYIYNEYQVFDLIELRLMYYLIEVANANQITYANQFFSISCNLTALKK